MYRQTGWAVRRFRHLLCVLAVLPCGPAWAQRANEDVLNSAQDAFGTTVGQESIGVYSANEARGFSPIRAGNIRIEGLYVYGSGITGGLASISNLMSQNAVRVGMSAQSYPFPSPTGIVDYTLRLPGDTYVASAVVRLGPYESANATVNGQMPVVADRLNIGINVYGGQTETDFGTKAYTYAIAGIAHWRVTDDIEVIPFWSRGQDRQRVFSPSIFMAQPGFPEKFNRGDFYGELWFDNDPTEVEFGAISNATLGDWRLRMGVFRSLTDRPEVATQSYINTRPDGSNTRVVRIFSGLDTPHTANAGEARLSRTFIEGQRRHTFNFNTRGRLAERRSGGAIVYDSRPTVLGVYSPLPEPASYAGSVFNIERIRQGSLGVSYEGQWIGVGEFSTGVQRVAYRRRSINPDGVITAKPWLYYASAAAYVTDDLALYGSYTRGLEDSPIAPASATNSTQGVQATISRQIDAGFRYAFTPTTKLIAGVFDIEKPFFGLDRTFFYRELGSIRHQGIELSLSGRVAEGLTVIGGAVFLKARLAGELLAQGNVPAGTVPINGFLNIQYGPKSWNGFSIDGRVDYDGSYLADSANTFRAPAVAVLDLGARYRFSIGDSPAALRVQVQNVLNDYHWTVTGTLFQVMPTPRRRFTTQLTVDF